MPKLETSRRIDAPADRLWSLLTTVADWPRWGPTVAGVELATETIRAGSEGRVRTSVGVWLPFEVTEYDEGSHWAWTVAGVRATEHAVRRDGDGSVVTFGVPWWAPPYLAVCALALRRLEHIATA